MFTDIDQNVAKSTHSWEKKKFIIAWNVKCFKRRHNTYTHGTFDDQSALIGNFKMEWIYVSVNKINNYHGRHHHQQQLQRRRRSTDRENKNERYCFLVLAKVKNVAQIYNSGSDFNTDIHYHDAGKNCYFCQYLP